MAVFQQILGHAFTRLPPQLQRVHCGDHAKILFRGRCNVVRGRGLLIGVAARLAALPPAAQDVPIGVTIHRDPTGETWTRRFGAHEMKSRLWADGALLAERLGAMTFSFRLQEIEGRIEWRVHAARVFGMRLPTKWFENTTATELIENDRYTFDVRATLPLLGTLISYHGWLVEHD
jgi:hypothetical protein